MEPPIRARAATRSSRLPSSSTRASEVPRRADPSERPGFLDELTHPSVRVGRIRRPGDDRCAAHDFFYTAFARQIPGRSTVVEFGYGGTVITSPTRAHRSPSTLARAIAVAASLAAVAVVAMIGRTWTDTSAGSWYDGLRQPAWTPPGAAFGIAWGLLYVLMAVAAWLVVRDGWDRRGVPAAIAMYGVQLVLNLGWTWVFFELRRPGWAIIEILVLLAAIVVTIWRFAAVSRPAAWLMVPYAIWVAFATSLTIGFAALN